jgi:hypothetical protein
VLLNFVVHLMIADEVCYYWREVVNKHNGGFVIRDVCHQTFSSTLDGALPF